VSDFLLSLAKDLINLASNYGPFWFYVILFSSNVIENLFPPYPGDTVILIGGYLASLGKISFLGVFFTSLFGCLTGALILYSLGKRRGRRIFYRGKILNPALLSKIEGWFNRYGEKLILASRFLTGIRSGVALFAGVGNVSLKKMIIYSAISIALWNGLLIYFAVGLHKNWQNLYEFFVIYNRIILGLFILGLVIILAILLKKRLESKNEKGR